MTGARRLLACAALTLAATVAALPAAAHGSASQESMFQDDNQLIYSSESKVRENLDRLRALGVDRLRITVLWKAVAPEVDKAERPAGFQAQDPGAYPADAWKRYDTVLALARERGMDVNFNVTAPGPLWAMKKAPREDVADTYRPDPTEFGHFVAAAARRYSGSYTPRGATQPLPRVSYWSIYNEPNQSGWLTPQWEPASPRSRKRVEAAPVVYRGLADAAYSALAETGHGSDTILIGELAPSGSESKGVKRFLRPLRFIRVLYCVDSTGRPLRGARAAAYGCPRDGNLREFARRHPVLYRATGFAHHPYNLLGSPLARPTSTDDVVLGVLSRLTRTLDKAYRAAGVTRRVPLYLTEFGFQTMPPDPYAGVSWRRQAEFLDQSEYIAYRNRRVRALCQFLLVDDVPIANFQTGLMDKNGRRKPSFTTYRQPIYLSRSKSRKGGRVRVWSLLRTAPNGQRATAAVEFRARGSKRFGSLGTARANARGYLGKTIRLRRSGSVRVAYRAPGAKRSTYSRSVTVTVR